MDFITLLDYLLLPFYLVVIFMIANNYRNKHYPPGHPWRPYFMPGLMLKVGGAIFIGLIYQYYYGGGDTFNYYYHTQSLYDAFGDSPVKWFDLMAHIPSWYDGFYAKYTMNMWWYESPSEYMIVRIASLLGMLTFDTYLPISVLFGALAFTGMWAMFRTFATQYPMLIKYVAWCVLFIPSTIMWGSGIFKDTICMLGLGWMVYGAFKILINRDFSASTILLTVCSFYLIAIIKIYILMAFLPAMALWILFSYSHKIRSSVARFLVKVGVIGMAVLGFLFFSQKFAAELGRYSLANIAKTSYVTSTYIRGVSGDGGSGYDLGTIEPSIGGMMKKFLPAVNVTLFRPYIWETRKVMQLLNAVEAMMFLWVTLKVLFVVGLGKVWKTITSDPNIQFCLIFTIIFAFAVGISSGNFGALSRYRIPCLPFFGLALVLIYYKNQPLSKNILSFRR